MPFLHRMCLYLIWLFEIIIKLHVSFISSFIYNFFTSKVSVFFFRKFHSEMVFGSANQQNLMAWSDWNWWLYKKEIERRQCNYVLFQANWSRKNSKRWIYHWSDTGLSAVWTSCSKHMEMRQVKSETFKSTAMLHWNVYQSSWHVAINNVLN